MAAKAKAGPLRKIHGPGQIGRMPDLMRHILTCNNAELPRDRRPVRLRGASIGWARSADMVLLGMAETGHGYDIPDAAALAVLARQAADAGLCRWRDEAFDIRAEADGPVLAEMDRGAIPILGCLAEGVHVNGLQRRADGVFLWVGRRAMNKPLDPGKLDNLVGGGVSAGYTAWQAMIKEAGEEAGLGAALAARAMSKGIIRYSMQREEGLRRDRLHVFDLELPQDFTPHPVDGEVTGFELWPLSRVLEAVRETEEFKFNVNLVLIDLFLREGLIDPDGNEGRMLRAGLRSGPVCVV